MELQAFLRFIVSGGGAGLAAYWLLDNLKFLAALQPKWKRISAFLVSAVIADLAFVGLAYLGYAPLPVTAVAWLEQLFAVGTSAFGLSQLIHTKDLKNRPS